MRLEVRHQLSIVVLGVAVFFTNLGVTRLWDQDEAFFARAAVEMQQRHDWVVPYFNGELFAHKPPFMFWMMRIGFELFGVTEFAARFWSAAFGVATALLVYQLGKRLFNPRVGLLAGIVMCTALMFDVVGRAATPDSFLVFFCTLPLFLFARHERWGDNAIETDSNSAVPLTLSAWTYASIYAAMGIAVLVKGPIGVLLPGSVLGLYLLTRDPVGQLPEDVTFGDRVLLIVRRFTPNRIVATIWQMRPFTALAAVLLVAGPWFALVGWRTGGVFLREFFGTQNYGRFVGAMDNHGGGVWYYVPAILAGFFPWSIFAIPTAVDLVTRCRGRDWGSQGRVLPSPRNHRWGLTSFDPSQPHQTKGFLGQRGAKLLACLIAVYVVFFSIAGTKLPNYVLPAYPALALATGLLLDRWLSRPETASRWWPRLSFGSLLVVGLTIGIAALVVAHAVVGGHPLVEKLGVSENLSGDLAAVGWLGVILAAGGICGIVLAEMHRLRGAIAGLAITSVAFSLGLFAIIAVQLDRHQPTPAVAEAIYRNSEGAPQVAQFGYFRPSLVYYTDTRVEACKNIARVVDFLKQSNDAFVVTTDEHYGRLAAQLPADVVVLDRQPEFPHGGTVLVLGRKTIVAQRTAATTPQ